MPQSLSHIHIHLVFSTKNRMPFLRDDNLRTEMHSFLSGVSAQKECPPVLVGGTEDHVHLLCRLGRSISLAEWIKELKRVSSLWIKERDPRMGKFSWQAGYGAFSVSASNVKSVQAYIAEQENHHRKVTFQDEYRAFLRKHDIEWDERYVWD